jgi:hypothetical protein
LTEFIKETVRTESTETPVKEEVSGTETAGRVVYFLFGLLEVLLAFRIIFKLSGASHGSYFVDAIYSLTRIFLLPFSGIFPQATGTGVVTTAVLEPAALVAVIVYAILAWGIVALIRIISGERKEAD